MLARILIFAGIVAAIATQVPSFFEQGSQQGTMPQQAPVASTAQLAQPVSADPLGSIRIPVNAQGHYIADFRINGKEITGIIDTGATLVSINETTARRLGFTSNSLDYRYTVNTANGQAKAAKVQLDRIEIGSVRVRDVDAMVMKDEALGATLIGASFLGKLNSYGVENGAIKLVQ